MTLVSDAELQVRLRRAAFNRALAEADIAAIGPILAPEVILITGTDSAVIAGRKAQIAAWKREFSANPRTIYVRTTDSVTVSAVEPIALEHGHWQGLPQSSPIPSATGHYAAKWRLLGEHWQLIGEIFVTLA